MAWLGDMPWWGWLSLFAVWSTVWTMAKLSASETIDSLRKEVKDKTREVEQLTRINGEVVEALVATGTLSYKDADIQNGQKFWRVTGVKERVVYQQGDKWGAFIIHNKDANGVPTKTEIVSLGWVDKPALMEYLHGNMYRLEQPGEEVQDFEDDPEETVQEHFEKQMSAIGLHYKKQEGDALS